MPSLIIQKKCTDELLNLALIGDLDANSSIELDNCIEEALLQKQFQILIDCKDLNYISSAGLGVFISYMEDFKQHKGNFAFFNMSPEVEDVFKMLGLDQVLYIGKTQKLATDFLLGATS